nr:Chain B, Calcium/calmodulin-dependent Protein Kinase Type Ii Subunit Alpha [Mus musculus]
ATRNFSG